MNCVVFLLFGFKPLGKDVLLICVFIMAIFSKDNPTGHSERKKKKRQTEEEVGRQYQRVDRNGLCQLN